ncbi:MAG: DUF2027 domain-containing protein [Bacteroidales bacterium]|jgi:hypothetical protein|nr:DUF2027 domain-containing protein [Bacteroidales bacterium]
MMNFRKGDQVKFLNDVGQGTIVKFQDEKIALVLNEDGFEIPVLISELLKIEGDYTFNKNNEQSSGNNNESSKPQKIIIEEDDLEEDGLNTDTEAKVFFALVPKNQNDMVNSDLGVYLINDSNFRVSYAISKAEDKFQSLFAYGTLEDNTKVILETIKRENLNNFEEINFQLLFFRKGNYFLLSPVNKTWNVKPARFFKQSAFTENDFFHENAFIYTLTSEEINLADHISDSDIEKSKKEKDIKEPRKRLKSSKSGSNQEIEEVDLHIHELVDDHSKLSNSEILDIQMSRFTTTLEGGIIAGTRKMVFIHGIGNGRLKHEVSKTLDRKYPKLKYQDASFKEYGYGATMVIIK